MKVSSNENSAAANSSTDVLLTLAPRTETFLLYQRKSKALKLVADCKQYISSKNATEELQERINALKAQDSALSTMETIVILLDYAERETVAVAQLEKGEVSFLTKSKNFFQTVFNIFE
ncbi:hypothetical protein SHI21_18030 [Bacteriovorax sp. PP10]|uniref:Uncharacterized protein n=1 Tax=Bacteriovorax antarcticus TaxID=3088717 RepID=A0ABU5VYI4_9BACT|nr:hypothetical protein [Bacteriovorax sp. PP10]MEA9358138.1 hypothetical protein [Bacteriovorax sp. PP10]